MMTPDASRIRPGEGRRLIVQILYSSERIVKIKTVLGHRDIKMKRPYTHGLHLEPAGVRSPVNGVQPIQRGVFCGSV